MGNIFTAYFDRRKIEKEIVNEIIHEVKQTSNAFIDDTDRIPFFIKAKVNLSKLIQG